MIAISSEVFDILGHVVLSPLPSSDYGETSRRANRVPTLDGGVAVNDSGFAEGDRTVRIRWRPRSQAEINSVQRMVQLYSRVRLTMRDGVFSAVPLRVRVRNGREADLELLIIKRA